MKGTKAMITRAHTAPVVGMITVAVFLSFCIAPPVDAQDKPVDKTGLDILCSGKGDTYSPPSKSGISTCIFADGQVMTCDSKTDKCTTSLTGDKGKANIAEGAMTLRLLKQLNDKVDRLTKQVESLSRPPSSAK
jgi:hypothetical protein